MTEAIPPNSTTKEGNQSNFQEEEDQGGELRRGPWTLEEDTLLIHYISCHGEGRWNLLAKSAGLKRTGKSCRLRWLNYLKPDIKRGNLSPQEQILILELHSKWGNRWSRIAQHLPGRTDNEIKNYWRTRVQKQARQLNMESNSQRFVDAIKCFYMPRLIQKIEQTSSASSAAMNSGEQPTPPSTQNTIRLSPPISKFGSNQGRRGEENPPTSNGGSSQYSCMSFYSQLPEISDDQHRSCSSCSPAAVIEDQECYYVDSQSTVYDDKDEPASMSGTEASDASILDYCQLAAGNDWPGHDYMADDDIWNLDQLWHFRK